VFVRGARQLGGSGTKDEKEEDDDDYFGEEALAHRTRQWLPKDVHSVGRKYSGPLSAAGGGPSTAASSAAASRRAANTAMLGQETAARQFTSIVSSPTANFLLAGAASTQDPGLYLLQNESYKEDVTAPLSVDDVSALDQTTPVYDIAWQSGTVVGASANGVVRLWTLDPSNRVQTTATFLHSVRKSTGGGGAGPAMSAPPPGSMYNDRRVLKVRLIGKESSQMASVDADAISLWDISHPETPVYSEKVLPSCLLFIFNKTKLIANCKRRIIHVYGQLAFPTQRSRCWRVRRLGNDDRHTRTDAVCHGTSLVQANGFGTITTAGGRV